MKNVAKIVAFGLLAPQLLFAQATSTINIAIEGKSIIDIVNDDARINLLGEALKQYPTLKANANLEISMVRFEAKSGVGGAQFFLRINNNIVDGAVVETNSKLKDPADTTAYVNVELKNIDRSALTEASLMLQSLSKLKLKNIQLVLGSPEEPAIFGHYADQQINQIGGGAADGQAQMEDVNVTTDEQVANVFERYYGEVIAEPVPALDPYAPTVVAPTPAPVKTRGGDCLLSDRGVILCTGAVVSSNYQGAGIVTDIYFDRRGNHQAAVAFNNGANDAVNISDLRIIDSGRSSNSPRNADSCIGNLCVGSQAMDRSSQLMTIRQIQTFRGSSLLKVESRYGQSFVVSSYDLTAVQAQPSQPTYQPQAPVVQQQQPSAPPVAYDSRKCVTNKVNRQVLCVGSRVTARTNQGYKDGYVVGVRNRAMGKDTVDVRLDMGATMTYKVDEVFKK